MMIYHDGNLIVTHPRCEGRYRCQTDRAYYAGIYHREHPELRALRYPHPSVDGEVQIRDLAFYEGLVEGGAR